VCRSTERHLDRFDGSIAALALPPAEGVRDLLELAAGAAPPDHVLRVYRSVHTLVATVAEVPGELDELRARGVALRTVDFGTPSPLLTRTKATSYEAAFAATRIAVEAGAYDALLVRGPRAGRADRERVGAVWRHVRTPPVGAGVLPGVTRSFVLETVPVEEAELFVDQLLGADEVFITSSVREVMPFTAIDGATVGDARPGPLAARLQAELRLRSTA
jgi:branched-subunit amino acid aminotransferase/4-amino-4-deoxychorismate lyase